MASLPLPTTRSVHVTGWLTASPSGSTICVVKTAGPLGDIGYRVDSLPG